MFPRKMFLSLSKWMGNTSKIEDMYDDKGDKEYNPFMYGFDYDENGFIAENTTTVRNIEKVCRNHPCP